MFIYSVILFRPVVVKPPIAINSPTISGQSGSTAQSDESDEEIGFYSDDDDDFNDNDNGENLWEPSSPVSDEDITYESLV